MLPTHATRSCTTGFAPYTEEYYREWRRRQIARMSVTYVAPLVLLILYFQYRYAGIEMEGRRMQLAAVAEQQASALDLYLTERRLNLVDLMDRPGFSVPPAPETMEEYLAGLRQASDAFVDLGFFEAAGVQAAYAGPHASLMAKDYSGEDWYRRLAGGNARFVITDIYPGFRLQPHCTIAVGRFLGGELFILRATLDPVRMYAHVQSRQASDALVTSVVNAGGVYQLVDARIGHPLEMGPVPVTTDRIHGEGAVETGGASRPYVFRWLRTVPWCLIVQAGEDAGGPMARMHLRTLLVSAALLLAAAGIILRQSGRLVARQKRADQARGQLEHAAKLASVGELAAGIAHEVNNPLAVITVESGLLMDYTDPQFRLTLKTEELRQRLQNIQAAAFRCRDIIRKLLSFVRQSGFDIRAHDIHKLIDGVIVGLLGDSMAKSNIEVVRRYAPTLPPLVTDGNQLQQVILSIVNNARDAVGGTAGRIEIETSRRGDRIVVSVRDNGVGMTPEVLDKLFVPFFTTKEAGKGTGLGLSVSYGTMRSLGGDIEVESTAGQGSVFRLVLPVESRPPAEGGSRTREHEKTA